MEQHSFGHWLRRKRKALDYTREGLADRVGCSAATIRKIEAEERRPSAQIAERLAEIFSIPHDERTAFLRFARGDWRSAPAATREDAPWRVSSSTPRSNLPATVNALIGREHEIFEIRNYLLRMDIRLVTLIGPPGIGKTRLSIEVARQSLYDFSDAVFFVALAPLDGSSLIGVTIAQALGYVGARNMSTSEQLKEGIGEKQMLIVLDNCEHFIEDVSSLASFLLSACPHLKILATSRESLRIPGEWLYPVPAFDVPDEDSSIEIETISDFPALTLFAERARAVRPDFVLDAENVNMVSTICAQLDGLPLAIELIAARLRLMSPQTLLKRLNDQFILSADGMRAASARQKTLNNAIGWSYNLLSEEEQKLFAYLSVFSGRFTLDAAERMFSKTRKNPVSNLVNSLLDKSLLQRIFDESGEPLLTMLVTIQNFARERLREVGEEIETRNLHLTYFLDLAEKADRELRGHNQLEWLSRLHAERDNLRAALQWAIETAQTASALQLVRKFHWFLSVIGDHSEGRHWLGRVVALPDALLYPEAYAEALTQLAHHIWIQTGPKEARPLVEQAFSVARVHNDPGNIARGLVILSLVLIAERNFTEAQTLLAESQLLFQEVGDPWGYAHAMMGLGLAAYLQDDEANTLTLHQRALMLFRELGDRYFQGVAHRFIGNVLIKQGDWTRGAAALREALVSAQALNSQWETYAVVWSFAEAAQRAGNHARAVRLYWGAKNIANSIGAWQQDDDIALQDNLAICRATLGESAFAEAVEEGRGMTMEQAVAYSLENSNG